MQDIIREDKRHKLDRPITGIIQKDRIWEQWYDPKIFSMDLPKMTQKDYLFKSIGSKPDRLLINYRNKRKYSVSDFQKLVLDYEKAFSISGLKKGDIICTIGLTTPELYAIKYASTSLGIITCNLNVLDMGVTDEGKNRLFRQIENVDPKIIFTLDYFEDKIYPVINNEKFKSIIKVSMPLNYSAPKYDPERILLSLKKIKNGLEGKKVDGSISLNDFLIMGRGLSQDCINEVYEEKMPCNISFTSGTSGINKPVLLSHDANNALAFQQQIGELGFREGMKHLALVPPFLAFWDADIVHAALCVGGENIIELTLENEKVREYFKKYNIEIGVWSQYTWSALLNLPKEELKKAVAHLEMPIIGGERCEVNAAEKFFEATGVRQMTGYGASEVNTTFSVNHPYCNKLGSCGLPLPFNNLRIVGENFEDLTYNQPGRILLSGPCLMNEYYNNPELTKSVILQDKEGTTWYYTGDYGVLDMDGSLTVLDRYKAPIEINTKEGKSKVNLLDVIELIKKNRNIRICKMFYKNNRIMLHVELDDFYDLSDEEKQNSVLDTIRESIPEIYWPNCVEFMESMPRTSVGKVNYKELEAHSEALSLEISEDKLYVITDSVKLIKKK